MYLVHRRQLTLHVYQVFEFDIYCIFSNRKILFFYVNEDEALPFMVGFGVLVEISNQSMFYAVDASHKKKHRLYLLVRERYLKTRTNCSSRDIFRRFIFILYHIFKKYSAFTIFYYFKIVVENYV